MDDSGAAVRLLALVNPEHVLTVEGFRHGSATTLPGAHRTS